MTDSPLHSNYQLSSGNDDNSLNSDIHIIVLYGGESNEREVSIESGKAVTKALSNLGYRVTVVDYNSQEIYHLLDGVVETNSPDMIFNALHGGYGEDGHIQALSEIIGIPCSHSDMKASAIAMHKPTAKALFKQHSIPTLENIMIDIDLDSKSKNGDINQDFINRLQDFAMPFIVKPSAEGSSVGIFIVENMEELQKIDIENILDKDIFWQKHNNKAQFMAEKYVKGREINVAILDGQIIGDIEIKSANKFYDYNAKYESDKTQYQTPADLSDDAREKLHEYARKAWHAIGARDIARADFIYDGDEFYILEINTQPGFTKSSLFPKIAASQGISFENLVEIITRKVLQRNAQNQ